MSSTPKRAVFLDRDGVLNHNIWYEDVQAWESPRTTEEFKLHDGILPALIKLREAGFLLFVVSNQPNVVNGKGSEEVLAAQDAILKAELGRVGVTFTEVFYCTHHPNFTGRCDCRKPSPHFLQKAAGAHGIDLGESWMVGDRVTDMQCGRAAGAHTAWIETGQEPDTPEPNLFDVRAAGLAEFASLLASETLC